MVYNKAAIHILHYTIITVPLSQGSEKKILYKSSHDIKFCFALCHYTRFLTLFSMHIMYTFNFFGEYQLISLV